MFRDLVRAWVWHPGLLDSVQVGDALRDESAAESDREGVGA